ncbi:MAG: PKD domain-containing protein [Chitinophagales bacterium]
MKSLSYTSQQFRSVLCSMALLVSGFLIFHQTASAQCSIPVSIYPDTTAVCGSQAYTAYASGSSPFQYAWSNGVNTASNCQQLSLGQSICVTVTDAAGCQGTSCYVRQCQMYVYLSQDTTLGCSGQPGFSAYVSNAQAPVTYQWSNGSTATQTCAALPVGQSICVTVTDAAGCQLSKCFTASCNISGNLNQQYDSNVTCSSGNHYTLDYVSGGVMPYSYHWSNGSAATSTCESLLLGQSLCVSITDANGCQATLCYTKQCTVGGYVVQNTSAVCPGSFGFQAIPVGGDPPYQLAWDNGQTGPDVCANVPLGQSLCVTITDANGCQASACYQANCNINATVYPSYDSTFVCPGSQKLIVEYPSGGLQPYSYLWPDGSTGVMGCSAPGQPLCVQITDANGCQASACYQGAPPCQAFFNYYLTGNNQVQFVNQSAYNPVNVSWSFGDGDNSTLMSPSHTYAGSGTYSVCLTTNDASGCSSTSCYNVVVTTPALDVAAVSWFPNPVPGFVSTVYPSAYNVGTQMVSGQIFYQYPAGLTFENSVPAPDAHDPANRLLTYNYNNLIPGQSFSAAVNLYTPVNTVLGTVVADSIWVTPLVNDVYPVNNQVAQYHVVVGSFDPNDKAVSPSGVGPEGVVPQSTTNLGYKIRFQNTGTAPAHFVVIRDSLDSSIDLSSIQITQSSHAHRFELHGNELIITFDNINLADSNANEAASHGFVDYQVKLKPGLPVKTRVRNTARIYFDYNEPVYTNTTLTTLGLPTGITEVPENFQFLVVPNPAQSSFRIVREDGATMQVEIISTLGEVVKTISSYNDQAIDIRTLTKGMYLVKATTANRSGVQRLLITE